MGSFVTLTRLTAPRLIAALLFFLLPLTAQAQHGTTTAGELFKTSAPMTGEWGARGGLFSGADFSIHFAKLFGRSPGFVPAARSRPQFFSDFRLNVASNHIAPEPLWTPAPLDAAVSEHSPPSASPNKHRKKSNSKRWIAGLIGASLTGFGGYLVATSDDPNPIQKLCTLCVHPPHEVPVSHAHIHLSGRQGTGVISILAGAGFLYYAVAPD